jgi:hypothetical protein
MARRKKTYEDDDGRTIADMSGVSRPRLILPGTPQPPAPPAAPRPEETENRPWEAQKDVMSREERRWYILGALKAALLIALVFIIGLGIVIALMIWGWG